MTHSTTLHNAQQAHEVLQKLWAWAKPRLIAGTKLKLTISEETRTLEQNSRMWAMLGEVSRQVDWYGQKLDPEDWKHVFTAALKKQRTVPGIDGGFVVLGQSTKKMSKAELGELMELIEAFGAQRGVRFATAEPE
jgi:hypothetical protein